MIQKSCQIIYFLNRKTNLQPYLNKSWQNKTKGSLKLFPATNHQISEIVSIEPFPVQIFT